MMKNQLLGIVVVGVTGVAAACSGSAEHTSHLSDNHSQTASATQATLATPVAAAPVRVGQPAPSFTAVDSKGKRHQLSNFKGKTVILEWTNHECPYVRKHYESGNMQKLQKQATGKGVVWLSVVSSAPGQQGHVNGQKANELTKNRGASPTAILLDADGKIGRLYSARTTPHMFVVAPNSTLAYMGAIDSISSFNKADVAKATNYVSVALDSVLKGEKVDTPATQPYGCTVKYGS
ncbi:MAG: redoxin domain-containing protein [Leptolyngbyaceae cyanobacterium RU_5_1]|nr:redoxin domain-containing protein [Leptolyngbyaceae cyanobacterium RU_5_1]